MKRFFRVVKWFTVIGIALVVAALVVTFWYPQEGPVVPVVLALAGIASILLASKE